MVEMATERRLYTYEDLRPLVRPKRVAVIGASERPGFGSRVVDNLSKVEGLDLAVVNPRQSSVLGIKSVPRIAEVEGDIDCAVLAVRSELAVEMLEECGARGVGSALVYAAGFAETNRPEGRRLQTELCRIALDNNIRLAGPNTLGVFNFRDGICIGNYSYDKPPGNIGVASQSGGLGVYLLQAPSGRVGLFSHCLCAGNSADVDALDYAGYLLEDETTKVVVLILEGIRSASRLMELGALSAEVGKPVIVCKTGRSESGARAALSHTGSLAGANDAVRAALARANLIEVEAYEDLLETALFFARARRPSVRGVGVITATGGGAVLACDAADEAGVSLPMPTEATLKELAEIAPDYGAFSNPADLTATPGGPDRAERALRVFGSDPSFDVVIMPLAPNKKEDRVAAVCNVARSATSTICVYWISQWLENPNTEALIEDPNVSTFRSLRRFFQTVSKWYQWYGLNAVAQLETDMTETGTAAPSWAKAAKEVMEKESRKASELDAIGGVTALSEVSSREVLAVCGLPLVQGQLCLTADEAADIALSLGYPVVLKGISAKLMHKTEADAVRLGLVGDAQVRAAFDEVRTNLLRHVQLHELEGILVTKMVGDSIEVLVGARRDAIIGPVVVCGLGGTLVELLGELTIDIAPVSMTQARAMIARMPGTELLEGFRGSVRRDIDSLANIIVGVSNLIASVTDIQEIDLNPVLVGADGAGSLIADSLVVLRADGQRYAKDLYSAL